MEKLTALEVITPWDKVELKPAFLLNVPGPYAGVVLWDDPEQVMWDVVTSYLDKWPTAGHPDQDRVDTIRNAVREARSSLRTASSPEPERAA